MIPIKFTDIEDDPNKYHKVSKVFLVRQKINVEQNKKHFKNDDKTIFVLDRHFSVSFKNQYNIHCTMYTQSILPTTYSKARLSTLLLSHLYRTFVLTNFIFLFGANWEMLLSKRATDRNHLSKRKISNEGSINSMNFLFPDSILSFCDFSIRFH